MSSALAALENANPDALRLARFASLAARIEPELLRALRIELCEGADASAEADLWWSDVVELRSPSSIRLSPVALRELRKAVAPSARDAYRVVQRLHVGEPQLAQLEEELTFLALTAAPGVLEQPLLEVLGTLLERGERTNEVASWAIQALPRLPEAVRDVPAFWSVLWAADAVGRGSARMDATPAPGVLQGALALVPTLSTGWVELETELHGDQLRLKRGRVVTEPRAELLLAPRVEPTLLEVESAAGRSVLALPHADWSKPLTVSGASVVVRTLGREHELKAFEIEAQAPQQLLPMELRLDDGSSRTAYVIGADCLATCAGVGEVGKIVKLAFHKDSEDVRADVVVSGRVSILRLDTPPEGWTSFRPWLPNITRALGGLSKQEQLEPNTPALLELPNASVHGALAAVGTSPTARFDVDAQAGMVGAPVLVDGSLFYQVEHVPAQEVRSSAASSEPFGLVPGHVIAEAIDDAQYLLKLLRQAAAFEGLAKKESASADVAQLRDGIVFSDWSLQLAPSEIEWLWGSGRAGRRWLALICIGFQKLHGHEQLVREALREPRNQFEQAEAMLAAHLLRLEIERPEPEPAGPRWLGNLGAFPWRLWPNGSLLGVQFMGGSKALQDRVLSIAQEWSAHAFLRFERVASGTAPVRVTFKESGNWSYHGNDCLSVAPKEPTMSLQLTEQMPEDELRHIVLHEFGHVLGLVNETQNPAARIDWDANAVYQELDRQKFSPQQVDQNVLGTYLASDFEYRPFDPESVMLNPIPEHWLVSGAPDLTRSAPHISRSDGETVGRLYPPPSVAVFETTGRQDGGLHYRGELSPRAAQVLRGSSESTKTYELTLESTPVAIVRLPDGRSLKTGEKAKLEVHGDWEISVASEKCFEQLAYSLKLTPTDAVASSSSVSGLNMMRKRLRRAKLPKREGDQFLVGTWHLNELGRRARLPATFALMAEVMSRFDITIVTGVRDASATRELSAALGKDWQCIVTSSKSNLESFALVVLDSRRVKVEPERPGSITTPLPTQQLGSFRLGATVAQLATAKLPRGTEEHTPVSDLVTTTQTIYRLVKAELLILTAFAGVQGPASPELDQIRKERVHLPSALTRHGSNPPCDQFFVYPRAPSPEETAGLIDLYERSPKGLFPDLGLTNQQAIDQLSVRSPAWILLKG